MKKVKVLMLHLLVILILLGLGLAIRVLGVKSINYVYGIFNEPITLAEVAPYTFNIEDISEIDEVNIKYWNKQDNKMYFGTINDKEIISEIYRISKSMKVKNNIINYTPLDFETSKYIDQGLCLLSYYADGKLVTEYYFVNQKYYDDGAFYELKDYKKELVDFEIFKYINEFSNNYDENIRLKVWR